MTSLTDAPNNTAPQNNQTHRENRVVCLRRVSKPKCGEMVAGAGFEPATLWVICFRFQISINATSALTAFIAHPAFTRHYFVARHWCMPRCCSA